MNCKCHRCGATVIGRFCSCCGYKVRSDLEEFRLAERQALKKFTKRMNALFNPTESAKAELPILHLANACWHACALKYGRDTVTTVYGVTFVSPTAYEQLKQIEEHAAALCSRLVALDDI